MPLFELLEELAAEDAPEIFGEVATETCRVISPVESTDEWGGVGQSSSSESGDLPCVKQQGASVARQILGQEYVDAVLLIPAQWEGSVVTINEQDRIKILERTGANPERTFQVRIVQNIHGVYYQVGVTREA